MTAREAAAGNLSLHAFPPHADRHERRFDIGCILGWAGLISALTSAMDEIVQFKKAAQLAQVFMLAHLGDVVIIGFLKDQWNM